MMEPSSKPILQGEIIKLRRNSFWFLSSNWISRYLVLQYSKDYRKYDELQQASNHPETNLENCSPSSSDSKFTNKWKKAIAKSVQPRSWWSTSAPFGVDSQFEECSEEEASLAKYIRLSYYRDKDSFVRGDTPLVSYALGDVSYVLPVVNNYTMTIHFNSTDELVFKVRHIREKSYWHVGLATVCGLPRTTQYPKQIQILKNLSLAEEADSDDAYEYGVNEPAELPIIWPEAFGTCPPQLLRTSLNVSSTAEGKQYDSRQKWLQYVTTRTWTRKRQNPLLEDVRVAWA